MPQAKAEVMLVPEVKETPVAKPSHDELIQRETLIRRHKLLAYEDYIAFFTVKAAGIVCLVTGALEIADPEMLPLVIQNPAAAAGIGFSLLAGNKAIDLLAKAINAVNTK